MVSGMPKSRARKRRARRRSAHARQAQERLVTMSLTDYEVMLTPRELSLLEEASVAERHGDVRRALECLRKTPRPVENRWERDLAEMVELADAAEPWQWARFTVAAAGRWLAALAWPLAARVYGGVSHAASGAGGSRYPAYTGWVAGKAAVRPAADGFLLFECGMIDVFTVQVAPMLARRSGGCRGWSLSSGTVYELVAVEGTEMTVRARADGAELTVLHLGEAVGLWPGALVYGHVVEVPGQPGRIFAAPPVVVDEMAARRLDKSAAEPDSGIDDHCVALGAAARSMSADVPPELGGEPDDEPVPRVHELMAEGLTRDDAEQFLSVEDAFLLHGHAPEVAFVAAYHAGRALGHERVFVEALRRYTGPEHEPVWLALADVSNGLQRQRMLRLAEACRGHAEAS